MLSKREDTIRSSPAKLSRQQFEQALRCGRGNALIHVLNYGLDGIDELVLQACLVSQAYDPQCEGHRAPWLYRMFKGSTLYQKFSEAIVEALNKPSEEHSIEQLCELASRMAVGGDEAAAHALRKFVWSQSFTSEDFPCGCNAIVLLDGLPALIELARRLGNILLQNPDEYVGSLLWLTEGTPHYDSAIEELGRASIGDEAIAAYLAREREEIAKREADENESLEQKAARFEKRRNEYLIEFPVERIFLMASAPAGNRPYPYSRFGRMAREADLDLILRRIETEKDHEVCLRLMWVFRTATPSRIPACIWAFAESRDLRMRQAALRMLANVSDPKIGEFSRKMLRRSSFSAEDADLIELLARNYQPGDAELILSKLENVTPSDDGLHSLGMSARRFCENNPVPEVAGIARWIYDTTPCSLCREGAVETLITCNRLPDYIAEECRYDANEETQSIVIEVSGDHSLEFAQSRESGHKDAKTVSAPESPLDY